MGRIKLILLIISFLSIGTVQSFSSIGISVAETDNPNYLLIGFFDLRDRESFVQITNIDPVNSETVHVQIFDVSNNCNENNFFDTYTPNDTHTYNLRDITTNDGTPSGVILPDNSYGVFAVYGLPAPMNNNLNELIGNLRIEDDNGYEYRTNLAGTGSPNRAQSDFSTFNFNNEEGISLSDIIIIPIEDINDNQEINVANVLDTFTVYDVDIYDLNENPFSCRNVIFACINQDSPLIEEILNPENVVEGDGTASVASFEYGINDAIPHSKGGELLCPGNNIAEGFVRLKKIGASTNTCCNDLSHISYVGLNNGNGRGSIDASITDNFRLDNF